MVLNRVLRVWEWHAGCSEVCVRPLDRSFTSQLILTGGCSRWLPSATSSPSSPRSCSRSSSVRPQEAWLMLQQFWVSTGGSMEFSTGPVLGRLRHRHPDSRLGLEGPGSSTLCCQGPITHNYHKQKGENIVKTCFLWTWIGILNLCFFFLFAKLFLYNVAACFWPLTPFWGNTWMFNNDSLMLCLER